MTVQVMQVRKKDDGKIYAMKVLRKDTIVARKQVAHTKAEKNVSYSPVHDIFCSFLCSLSIIDQERY